MKSRYLIWLSAFALVVLVWVQYIFITDTYRTKANQFDARFGELVQEGMKAFNGIDFNYGYDSLLYELDERALEYQYANPDTLVRTLDQEFYQILNNYEEAKSFLTAYLQEAGEEAHFTWHILLAELYLKDLNLETKYYPNSKLKSLPLPPPEALPAASYTHVRNFFRMSYSVYINFDRRSALIFREMKGILGLSLATILLVFCVFYMTIRNMMRQKRLSEMKTDFINNMTHELKTPLSTIAVASSSLGNKRITSDSARVEELSGIIKRQNKHLSGLIDRILDISIFEKDQVKLKPVELDLSAWLDQLCRAFRLEQGDHAPELELQLRLDIPRAMLDEVHMSTALNNLLSNAVKYGPADCKITLRAEHTKSALELHVSDNGPGIRREEQKHIFEKFYRGREAKTHVIRGLGLGLYYVKQIVEEHGGEISLISSPGEGSTFIIKIPHHDQSTSG